MEPNKKLPQRWYLTLNLTTTDDYPATHAEVQDRGHLQKELDGLFVPIMEVATWCRSQRLANRPMPKNPSVHIECAARELVVAQADSDDAYRHVKAAAGHLLQWIARQPALPT